MESLLKLCANSALSKNNSTSAIRYKIDLNGKSLKSVRNSSYLTWWHPAIEAKSDRHIQLLTFELSFNLYMRQNFIVEQELQSYLGKGAKKKIEEKKTNKC